MFSLFSRLSFLFTLILLALGILVWFIAHYSHQHYSDEISQQLNRPVAMYIAEQVPLFVNGSYDTTALASLAAHVMIINPNLDLYLLDPDGQVVASASGLGKGVVVDLAPVKEFLLADKTSPVYGDDPRAPGQHRIFSAFPLPDTGVGSSGCSPCGYVYAVLMDTENMVSPLQAFSSSHTLQLSTLMLAAVLLCALLAGLSIFFLLTKPLRAMTDSIAKWQLAASGSQNNTRNEMPGSLIRGGSELELLEQTCQAMAQRLSRQYIELDDADKRRRQFLTSLSHDLRTPLTSISGALEILISKADSLRPEERSCFLNVAFRQSGRLHQLIEQVFELARLDSGEVSLDIEPVSVQELAMDTAQDFEAQALTKGVTLSFEPVSPGLDCLVFADLAQLSRVLVNLLSNAIRHTPEGGVVRLTAIRHAQSGVVVSVSDSGCGFSKALKDFPLCRIDSSMYCKSGTGLGLGIVCRILALHGTEARVSSSPGIGTQIRFWLNTAVV